MASRHSGFGSSNASNLDYIINVEDSHQIWSLPLYKALNEGDWETVEMIIQMHPAAITARLTPFAETPLLVAVKVGQGMAFIRKLLAVMPAEALALTDYFGNTALHAVAVLGNTQAARLLVEKNYELPYIWNIDSCLPIHLAAMRGHREATSYLFTVTRQDERLDSDPFKDAAGATLVHFAVTAGFYVMYRHEEIFKIVHEQSGQYKISLSLLLDTGRNNILHLAAYRPHQHLLDLSSGAVLQMQRELQWYKEVEKFVLPQERKSKNAEGKAPLAIFNEEHRELAAHETQWMTGMATSCTVAASLIATVAFAAAITVPGGNNDKDGLPIFSSEKAFLVFAVSDALALLSSITTVLSFLSIFTSRYAVQDFLYALPNRLIIGLISLFLSVTSLMIAFGSTMFLVAAQRNMVILIPIIMLACVPVTLFASLQLPPLLNMINSTYGPSIFY